MEVSTFFARLLTAPKPSLGPRPDALSDFDAAWTSVVETLTHPDERQLARGVSSTQVPRLLKHITDALVYESNRTDEDTTGACLEYFLRHDLLGQIERLCVRDRPRGVKAEVLRMVNNLVVLMPERFLVHNAVHRPLRRLLRSCVGESQDDRVDGAARFFGAAATEPDEELDDDLVDLMCILCSRMRAYPPLLLIFFHDRGWLVPHPSSGAPPPTTPPRHSVTHPHSPRPPSRALSPTPKSPKQLSRALSPTPHGPGSDAASGSSRREGDSTHFEFFLFSYLLRFVHCDGRIGDFARAGVLFLFDIAFLSHEESGDTLSAPGEDGSDPLQDARDALAEYILDGDFADVMAAGLGATYSLLPNKLRVPTLAELGDDDAAMNGGMILGTRARTDDDDDDDLLLSTDEDVHTQLELLLKLFGFLQDIMYRCRAASLRADPHARVVSSTEVLGPAVADATLDALQTAFVDNVLYPSILECSSADGSAVAVLTYLDVVLSSLEDGPVLQRILNVLMDANAAVPVFTSPRKKDKNRKTGAMNYMPTIVKPGYYTDERFTLRDLILDNVKSRHPASSTAALHLLQTLLEDHCRYIAPSLLSLVRMPAATALARPPLPLSERSSPAPSCAPSYAPSFASTLPPPVNSTDVHLQEDELYGALVPRLDDAVQENTEASGLGSYLTDAHNCLETDGCWRSSRVPLQFVSDDGKPALLRVGEYETDPFQHALSPSDALVQALLTSLAAWFTQPVDANVSLTGALSALARCPHRSLAGWLLYDVAGEDDDAWLKLAKDVDDSTSDTSFDATLSRAPSRQDSEYDCAHHLPALYQVLRELVRHVGRFRASVPYFDRLLSERRQGLLFADHLEEAMSAMLEDVVVTPAPQASPGFLGVLGNPFSSPTLGERKKGVSLANSLRSFWSPRRSRPTTPTPGTPTSAPTSPAPQQAALLPPRQSSLPSPAPNGPSTPVRRPSTLPSHSTVPSTPIPQPPDSPFSSHYAAAAVTVQVELVHAVQSGPWCPTSHTPAVDHDVFRVDEDAPKEEEVPSTNPTSTTLSSVLDNMIVLEELIKELVGLIVARRALGVDQVGFVVRHNGTR